MQNALAYGIIYMKVRKGGHMADKGTTTDIAPVNHADEAAAKNFSLDKFLVKLQLICY